MGKKKEPRPSERVVEQLRREAHWVFLQGSTKLAQKLNKRADAMAAVLRQQASNQ